MINENKRNKKFKSGTFQKHGYAFTSSSILVYGLSKGIRIDSLCSGDFTYSPHERSLYYIGNAISLEAIPIPSGRFTILTE